MSMTSPNRPDPDSRVSAIEALVERLRAADGGPARWEMVSEFVRSREACGALAAGVVAEPQEWESWLAAVCALRGGAQLAALHSRTLQPFVKAAKAAAGRERARQSLADQLEAHAEMGGGPDPDVWSALSMSKSEESPTPLRTGLNLYRILSGDPRWVGRIGYCELRNAHLLDGEPMRDERETEVANWISGVYGLSMGTLAVGEQFRLVATEHALSPSNCSITRTTFCSTALACSVTCTAARWP